MKTKDLVRNALLAAILLVVQVSLSGIPNVELVSLLLIAYTLVFKKQVFIILYVFIFLEGLIYGFGLWWFSYLYVWPLLPLAVLLLSRNGRPHTFSLAVLSGSFGMLFGLFCSVSYLFMGGIGAAFSWWIAGIPFDMVHGISNFVVAMILLNPVYRVLVTVKKH